mgnify:CR=1 FL=1
MPTVVLDPPPAVPGLIVTYSRIKLFCPISRLFFPFLNLKISPKNLNSNNKTTEEKEKTNSVMNQSEIIEYQNLVKRVPISDNVLNYAVKVVSATRPSSSSLDFIKESVDWGAGPRASQFLVLAAKAKAILDGRPTPDIKDVQSLVAPILRHRVLPNFNAEAEGLKIEDILEKLLISIPE